MYIILQNMQDFIHIYSKIQKYLIICEYLCKIACQARIVVL